MTHFGENVTVFPLLILAFFSGFDCFCSVHIQNGQNLFSGSSVKSSPVGTQVDLPENSLMLHHQKPEAVNGALS